MMNTNANAMEDRLTRNLSVKPITIPHIRCATMGMIAEQYNLDYATIAKKYSKYKDEFAGCVIPVTSYEQFEGLLPNEIQFVTEKKGSVTNYMFTNAAYVTIKPGATKLFNEKGIRHLIELASVKEKCGRKPGVKNNPPQKIDLYKPDSKPVDISVPKEVAKTEFSNSEEETLLLNIAKAYKTGEIMNLLTAAMALDNYRQREIRELKNNQSSVAVLTPWAARKSAGKVVSSLVEITGERKYSVWDMFYYKLIQTYHIPLDERGKKPMIDGLKDDEWHLFYQAFADICSERYLNAEQILVKTGIDTTGLSIVVNY